MLRKLLTRKIFFFRPIGVIFFSRFTTNQWIYNYRIVERNIIVNTEGRNIYLPISEMKIKKNFHSHFSRVISQDFNFMLYRLFE